MLILLVLAVLFVAFANGANDNFKGVATLFGSGTAAYRRALSWGTLATLAGAILSLAAGTALLRVFTGQGLVPDSLVGDPRFLVAVALGASSTVLLATRLGLPISTTHALVGGLLGAGFAAAPASLRLGVLGWRFVLPLLLSPLAAILLTMALYLPFRAARRALGVEEETCLCVGNRQEVVLVQSDGTGVLRSSGVTLSVEEVSRCRPRYTGRLLGISAQQALEGIHYLSAGVVSLARGLNDTPKIVALLVAGRAVGLPGWTVAVAAAMAAGGWLAARRVGETMGHRITAMNEGQGFSANLATAILVIVASGLGLPVSTTHVSVGALFGIGCVNRKADPRSIVSILGAWFTTLPLAAVLSAAVFSVTARPG
jgi:PiT family inorganic phosphate transporter